MIRNLTIAALVIAASAAVSTAWARNYTNLSRREIRQMPILERPSRPGHFYGNAVRRANGRQVTQPMGNPWQGYSEAPRMYPTVQPGTVWFEDAQ
jgi:hypothetical protein